MNRIVGSLAGVLLLVLAATPAHAQNSAFTQVQCDQGKTIQAAVDNTREGGSIEVSGTCNEDVVVRQDRIKISGGGGAVVNGGANVAFMVFGQGVEIANFAKISGRIGVYVREGGSAHVNRNTNIAATDLGIVVEGSWGTLNDNVINGGDIGIFMHLSASGRLNRNTVDGGREGIIVLGASSVELDDNIVKNVSTDGFRVAQGAHAILDSRNTITGSGSADVSCLQSGVLQVFGAQTVGSVFVEPGCFNSGTPIP